MCLDAVLGAAVLADVYSQGPKFLVYQSCLSAIMCTADVSYFWYVMGGDIGSSLLLQQSCVLKYVISDMQCKLLT